MGKHHHSIHDFYCLRMDLLDSQDLVVIVVKDDLGDVKPLKAIKEADNAKFPLFKKTNKKGVTRDPFNMHVKIENISNENGNAEVHENSCKDLFFRRENIDDILPECDLVNVSVVKEGTQFEIETESKSFLLLEQDASSDTHNELYDKEELESEQEIEYLEEEYDEDCNQEKSGKEQSLEVSKSYISDLQFQFPELKEDEDLLIEVVARIMKELKHPHVPETYYSHTQNNGKFKCNVCGTKTDTVPAAERHYLEKHGSRYLVCYACGANFRSRGNLYRHEKKACKAKDVHIVLKARAMFLGKKGQNRPYLDMYQSAWSKSSPTTNGQKSLGINTKKNVCKNTIKSPQEYLCTKCPKAYVTKKALESHMNKHLGRRPYRCDKCFNAYSCPYALKQHLESHMNTPFICDICKRSFKWKASLIGHMNTHLPTKKYGCPDCDRRYAKSLSLKHHINRVHKNLPYAYGCQICHKRYSSMFILRQHMKKEHGLNIMSRATYIRSLPKMTEQDVLNAKIVLSDDLVNKDPVFLNN